MIHQLYKKQVEAWKERLSNFLWEVTKGGAEVDSIDRYPYVRIEADKLLSSRHKDTIGLIEAEIKRKKGMRQPEERGHYGPHDHLHIQYNIGYNSAIEEDIAYLEEQLKLIQKEI